MKQILLFIFLIVPTLCFGEIKYECQDYTLILEKYCETNDCSSIAAQEKGISESGFSIENLTPFCSSKAYKSIATILSELLLEEEEKKESAIALAEKRKNTNLLLGITTGVASIGAIGFGTAYNKAKKNAKCPECKECTEKITGCSKEQFQKIAEYGRKSYTVNLHKYLEKNKKAFLRYSNFKKVGNPIVDTSNIIIQSIEIDNCEIVE